MGRKGCQVPEALPCTLRFEALPCTIRYRACLERKPWRGVRLNSSLHYAIAFVKWIFGSGSV